ncbi:fatty acid desaturase [Allocatelliglobosispora scoriae]|uniref:Fatty acid desaturase n=1 Tax=Allocatelliglobosispora scoriae TaxID=643052 RepID=A0A841BQ17_9ACTN|nr:acyl-CoA desaturase [Allocatelliglobosispora scoriae]MBB5870354.1 fatty acid desaturase [Allocatelliglobosispora scoriae]
MSTIDSTITPLRPVAPPRRGSDYSLLLTQVKQAGLLDRRRSYYAVRMAINAVLLIGGWTAFVLLGTSWWQVATAAFLAVVFTQIGFVGHDAGHRQIFRSRRANDLVGMLHANLAIGLSYGWWVESHSRHHAHPNQEGKDPDIAIRALAFSSDQAGARGRIAGAIYRYQAFLFFPLLLGEGFSLHVDSARAVVRDRLPHRGWERLLLGSHLVGYAGLIFFVLPPLPAIGFILLQQGLFGLYLGCSFAPNHKGMPILDRADATDFLRRQVLTARNVRGGPLTDLLLGGLNYQIEHHLFPSMPRPTLRRAQPMIRAYCLEHGLPYLETGLVESYRQALVHLHTVGRNPTSGIADSR